MGSFFSMQSLQDPEAPLFWLLLVANMIVGFAAVIYVYERFFDNPERKKKKYPTVLPCEDFQPFTLIRKDILSHDTCRFVFQLPPGHVLGLPTGQHVAFKYTDKTTGEVIQRSYTPVSDNTVVGEVAFVIKVYKPNPPKFPVGGLMSQHVDQIKIGETLLMRGPKGHMTWLGGGKFTIKPLGKPLESRSCHYLGLMAGGTGITPMLQILQAVLLNNYNDQNIKVKLIYANQTESDILIRQELETLQKRFPERFQLWYTIDRTDEKNASTWKYSVGFINKALIEEHLLFPKDSVMEQNKKTQFLICGPPPMIKFACQPALTELGYSEKDWVIF